MSETIIVRSNESGLSDFRGGWVSCVKAEDGMFKVEVTKDQYAQMAGSDFDPWPLNEQAKAKTSSSDAENT